MNFLLNKIMGLLISLRAIATAKNKTKVRSEYPKEVLKAWVTALNERWALLSNNNDFKVKVLKDFNS